MPCMCGAIDCPSCGRAQGTYPEPEEFGPEDTEAGEEARQRWAERYDELNGAPEGEWDR